MPEKLDAITYYEDFFIFGIANGVMISACLFFLIFTILYSTNSLKKYVNRLYLYGTIVTFCYFAFSLYVLQIYFPKIQLIFPCWVFFFAKFFMPLGLLLNARMFIKPIPVHSLEAFQFWYKTRHYYFLIELICLGLFIVFIFYDNPIHIISITLLLSIINSVLGLVFAKHAVDHIPSKRIIASIQVGFILVQCYAIYLFQFGDINSLSQFNFMVSHILFSLFVLFFAFLYVRTVDRNVLFHMKHMSTFRVEEFNENIYQAIQKDELFIEYQPKINIFNDQVVGLEALVRWNHPTKGRIPPKDFIPFSESSFLINTICKYVIRKAVKDAQAFKSLGYALPISINFSVRDISTTMVDYLLTHIQQNNLSSDDFVIEITESLFLDMTDEQQKALSMLREAGIKLSLDDFSAGFSSLNYLDELGLSELKIDKALSQKINVANKKTVVAMIINMCHELNIEVVAEGVEDPSMKSELRQLSCQMVQGYGICRPKPFDELIVWLNDH